MRIRRSLAGLPLADVVLALALFGLKLAFVVTGTLMTRGSTALAVVSAAALTLPLAWRRRAPLATAAVVAAAIAMDDVLAGWNGAVISFDCSIIAAYSAGAHARQRNSGVALALLLGANVVDALGAPGDRTGNLALAVVVFTTVPWLVGQALRRERRRSTELQELAAALAAEREELARVAVSAERGRIARELHDIVAHAISVIAVQADAATKVLDHDADRARAPLATIQATARGALVEMRRLVGLLRLDEEAPLAPQPGLAGLDRLMEQTRDTGVPVTVEVTGVPRKLPETLDLTAFRIVQEGLTNVRKHARPALATVRLCYEDDRLVVEVRDDGRRPSDGDGSRDKARGHGLLGIAERVALLDGMIESQATATGFVLRATLPLACPPR